MPVSSDDTNGDCDDVDDGPDDDDGRTRIRHTAYIAPGNTREIPHRNPAHNPFRAKIKRAMVNAVICAYDHTMAGDYGYSALVPFVQQCVKCAPHSHSFLDMQTCRSKSGLAEAFIDLKTG